MSVLGERFFKLSNALFCYRLTPIQFTVYSFLVSSAGQKKVCWPSMKTIAANCGCSVNAARDVSDPCFAVWAVEIQQLFAGTNNS